MVVTTASRGSGGVGQRLICPSGFVAAIGQSFIRRFDRRRSPLVSRDPCDDDEFPGRVKQVVLNEALGGAVAVA
jgi:hypothetical protein